MPAANLTQAEADALIAMRVGAGQDLLPQPRHRRVPGPGREQRQRGALLHRLRPAGGSGVRRRRHGNLPRHGPREVCGAPTDATGGAQTVTVTAQDADANPAAGDRGRLTFQVTVFDNPTVAAGLTAANPAPFPAPSPVV